MQPDQNQQAGIYFHIPFCVKKCPYCDFYSITDLSLQKAFLKALMREMRMLCNISFLFDTIYIGGGTPSVLPAEDIDKIIETIRQLFKISADVEITMEVNPGAVDQERFAGYKSAGVNRISIGAQSFQKTNLAFLGRIHSGEGCKFCGKIGSKSWF